MNIYEVSRRAGVSIATVSRVVNGKSNVSDKTRRRVLEALEELDYSHNAIAAGLATSRTHTVGVLVADLRDTYFSCTAHFIHDELERRGFHMILCNTGHDVGRKLEHLRMLSQRRVDGIILVGSVFDSELLYHHAEKLAKRLPVVFLNAPGPNGAVSVLCDDHAGIALCVRHLYETGRRDPVFLRDLDSYSARLKERGFRETAAELLPGREPVCIFMKDPAELESTIVPLLAQISVDAFVCSEDTLAARVLRILAPLRPEIAVTGYDNSSLCGMTRPSITSVDCRMADLGTLAVEHLARSLGGEDPPARTVLTPRLIVREST